MSIAPTPLPSVGFTPGPAPSSSTASKSASERVSSQPLHRIADVRREQGVSLRSAARQLHTDAATVRHQESPNTDLRLSDLLQWQQVLDVPLIDLLVDPGAPLSRPVMERAQMVRLMKTAAAIREQTTSPGVQRLVNMLVDQLLHMMPELADVSAWHSVGQRRSLNEYGRIVERCVREDFFLTHRDD